MISISCPGISDQEKYEPLLSSRSGLFSRGIVSATDGTAVQTAALHTETFCHKGEACSWSIRPLPSNQKPGCAWLQDSSKQCGRCGQYAGTLRKLLSRHDHDPTLHSGSHLGRYSTDMVAARVKDLQYELQQLKQKKVRSSYFGEDGLTGCSSSSCGSSDFGFTGAGVWNWDEPALWLCELDTCGCKGN